ncbi:MAG: hypothetical protein HZB79_07565 [Deltaproteobacteria bacterium]|nr:hypothetical protein [Deltaproteobacteria bacterium]
MAAIWLTPAKIETNEQAKVSAKPVSEPILAQPAPPPDYQVIIDKDIFRPSRIKPLEAALKPPPPKFNVTGIFLVGDKKRALLGVEGKKLSSVKIGDDIEGFKVADILSSKVIMERDGERIEVGLKTPRIIQMLPFKSFSKAKQSAAQQPIEEEKEPPPPPEPPRPPGAPPIRIIPAPPRTR